MKNSIDHEKFNWYFVIVKLAVSSMLKKWKWKYDVIFIKNSNPHAEKYYIM